MKRLLAVMTFLLILCSGCTGLFKENNLSVYGNPQGDGALGLRAGTEIMENLELGASANYLDGQEEINKKVWRRRGRCWRRVNVRVQDEIDDWSYGVHLIRHFPMNGISPYVGGQATIGEGTLDIGNTIQPIGGVNIKVSDTASFFTEYQQETTSDEQRKVLFGLRLRF